MTKRLCVLHPASTRARTPGPPAPSAHSRGCYCVFFWPDCRYFDIARGSALESAAALDILVAKAILDQNDIMSGKGILRDIVSMLVGLIKSHSNNRVYETQADYGDE
jgi:hypothetical protein